MPKWKDNEIAEAVNLIKSGLNYFEISEVLNRSEPSVRNKLKRVGESFKKNNPPQIKKCLKCGNLIKKFGNKFCSKSCSATYNNKQKGSKYKCLNCAAGIGKKGKYCSINCSTEWRFNEFIKVVEKDDGSLSPKRYKRYLIHMHGEKCMDCGWNRKNIYSNTIPIELEHIDGNSENNKLSNLKLLCPNCHSLTPTYKFLNKGNGRNKRMKRYKQGKSY